MPHTLCLTLRTFGASFQTQVRGNAAYFVCLTLLKVGAQSQIMATGEGN